MKQDHKHRTGSLVRKKKPPASQSQGELHLVPSPKGLFPITSTTSSLLVRGLGSPWGHRATWWSWFRCLLNGDKFSRRSLGRGIASKG